MDRKGLARSLPLTVAGIAGVELLTRLDVGFQSPGLVVYCLAIYVAFRFGFWAGLACAAICLGYVSYSALALERGVGTTNSLIWRLTVLSIAVPGTAGVLGLLRDRYERLLATERGARAEAEAAREQTHRILESITDSFVIVDPEWRFTYVNGAAETLLRRNREELYGSYAGDILSETMAGFFQKYNQARVEGGSIEFEASSTLKKDLWYRVHAFPSDEGVTMYFRNVTEDRASEQHLRHMSMIDELTRLYNRRGFLALSQQQLKLANRKQHGLLLMFLDLDGLKKINDTHGHRAGDEALAAVADAMRESFRDSDVLGRIGGDEFAALALEAHANDGSILIDRLLSSLQARSERADLASPLTVSVGTAYFDPEDATTLEELIAIADRRMYERKRGKGRPSALASTADPSRVPPPG